MTRFALSSILFTTLVVTAHAQSDLDTMQIKSIQFGWKISTSGTDSCAYSELYEYMSGLFKRLYIGCSQQPIITISKDIYQRPFHGKDFRPLFEKFYFTDTGPATRRYYYDDSGYLDSLIMFTDKGSGIMFTEKILDKDNKLISTSTLEGKFIFEYDSTGRISRKILNRLKGGKQIYNYHEGRLTSSEALNITGTKINEERYQYDSLGRLIRADLNPYEFWLYEYKGELIKREQNWTGPPGRQKLREEVVYEYNTNGRLLSETWYEGGTIKTLIRYTYK